MTMPKQVQELPASEQVGLDMWMAYCEKKERCEDLQDQVEALTAERDHWKANHDNQVKRARVLIERTDMPLERVRAYEQIGELQSANIEWMRHSVSITKERDDARLSASTNDLMAGCTDVLRTDLIAAGVVDASVPPMMLTEAIMRHIQALNAELELARMKTYCASISEIAEERDALKAELQSMQDLFIPHGTGPGAMGKILAEEDALKADANRYQWLRRNSVHLSFDNTLIALLLRDQSELDGAMSNEPQTTQST